jgi:hypothetical protein
VRHPSKCALFLVGLAVLREPAMRLTLVLTIALAALPGCHHEAPIAQPKAGEAAPLPPASGTPLGYLIDSSFDLKLREDQLKQLQEIDASLAARDAEIDTQLRQIERPDPDEAEAEKQAAAAGHPRRHNNAPGAAGKPTGDAAKLHDIRNSQDRDALTKVWAILDKDQQTAAAKILSEHDVEVPGQKKKVEQTSEDGTPVPGLEP